MPGIVVNPLVLNEALAGQLERLGLVSFLHHPEPSVRMSLADDYYKGDNFPVTAYGFHSVTITYTRLFPAYHPPPADEIVMVWDSLQPVKPLYFFFSIHRREEYLERLRQRALTERDFLSFKVIPNDPRYSCFRVHSNTIHCEFTRGTNDGVPFPSFFVLEPDPLPIGYPGEAEYDVSFQVQFPD